MVGWTQNILNQLGSADELIEKENVYPSHGWKMTEENKLKKEFQFSVTEQIKPQPRNKETCRGHKT